MIPKRIHYIWFGNNSLGDLQQRCIASWSKYLPEYEVIKWDEGNFDVSINAYCREAYDAQKWAFVSDYVRLWVLVNHGGIYMDTDVEVVASLDPFLQDTAFSGFESPDCVPTGIMACEKGHPFFAELLEAYKTRHFLLESGEYDTTTNVSTITEACTKAGLVLNNTKQTVAGFTLYPADYFCPKDHATGMIKATENTCAIHHFDGSWLDSQERELRSYQHNIAAELPCLRGGFLRVAAELAYGLRNRDASLLIGDLKRRLHK